MTTALQPTVRPAPAAVPDVPVCRLTVDQYRALLHRAGTDREPVELLEGWMVPKRGEDAIHATSVDLTIDALGGRLPPGYIVRGTHPVTTEDSEPQPDVLVARGGRRDYAARHPTPTECALVVEVANTSVRYDRGIKRRIYARAGVPVYWIVVLPERAVEVYTGPSGPAAEPAYAAVRQFADGDRVPVVVDGVEVGTVAVADLLP